VDRPRRSAQGGLVVSAAARPEPSRGQRGTVFYTDSERRTTAISEQGRVMLWRSDGRNFPVGWWDRRLLLYAGERKSVQWIEPHSGRICHETGVPGGCVSCVSGERWVAGTGYKEQATIWCLDPRERDGRLVEDAGRRPPPERNRPRLSPKTPSSSACTTATCSLFTPRRGTSRGPRAWPTSLAPAERAGRAGPSS